MAFVLADRVRDTTTTTGTGTVTLSGTAPTGYQTFGDGIGNGNNTYYTINADSQWEVGIGTYSASGTTLARNTVLASSNGGALVDFALGVKDVFVTYPAEKAVTDVYGTALAATTAANIGGGAAGSIPYQTAANTTSLLAAGTGVLIGGATPSYTMSPSLTQVTVAGDPTVNLQVATKQYVDTQTSAGIHYHQPVRVESPINLNATYNNGTAGVGATLTNAGTQAALVIDGVTVSVNDRVLIYEQTDETQNGIYDVTSVGSGSTNWVLTRSSDADTYVNASPDGLSQGSTVFVQQGTTGAGETYTCNTVGTITFGTTNITFAQISSAQIYSAGTGLTLTGTVFSLTAPVATSLGGTGLTAFTSGGAVYATSASVLTTGTLPATAGGTGQSSYTAGDLLYATSATTLGVIADVATGNALISGGAGADPSYGKIGLTTHISGTLAVGNGGTGATSLTGYLVGNGTSAFTTTATIPTSDLSGTISLTTQVSGTLGAGNGGTGISSYTVGDILYASGTTTLASLADVATGNALISGGVSNAPLWGKIGLTTHVSGTLPVSNGGSGATTLTGYLKGNGTSAFTASATIPSGDITGAALTKADDTNVTLTLGGSPSTALLAATSITAGWSGQLAVSRGGTGNSTLASGYLLKGNGVSPTSASVVYDDGTNVGIGTASPASRLQIAEANRADSTNISNVGIYTTTAQSTGVGGTLALGGLFNGSDLAPFGSIRGGKQNSTSGNYDGYLAFQTIANGGVLTEKMRIDSAGNLGVGTASPAGRFHALGPAGADVLYRLEPAYTYASKLLISSVSSGDGGIRYGTNNDLNVLTYNTMTFNTGAISGGVGTERLTINISGNVTANVDMRAPIFYDSNNTGYYIDPASTSVTSQINVGTGLNVFDGAAVAPDPYGIVAVTRRTDANYSYYGLTRAGQHAMGMGIDTGNVFWIGGLTANGFNSTRASTYLSMTTAGNVTAPVDMRAPIFYDSNNTAFYADMAGTSEFNTLQTRGGSGVRAFAAGSASISSQLYFANAGNTRAWNWQLDENNNAALWHFTGAAWARKLSIVHGGDGQVAVPSFIQMDNSYSTTPLWDSLKFYLYKDSTQSYGIGLGSSADVQYWSGASNNGVHRFYTSRTMQFEIGPGGACIATGDLRAPIFYDSNNTGYYVDPAAATALSINGGITFATANPYITAPSYFVCPGGAYFNGGTVYTEANIKARGGVGNDSAVALTLTGGTGGYTVINGSARSPIFYDTDNTGFYLDPAGFSNMSSANGMWMCGTTNPADTINGSTWYGTGRNNLDQVQLAGYYGIRLRTAGVVMDLAGDYAQINGSYRAPIYYDSNNTAFYWDFGGSAGSNIDTVITGAAYFLSNRNTSSSSAPLQAYSTGGLGATMAFHRAGVFAVNMGLDSDNVFRIGGWSASNNLIQLDMSGNFTALGNVTAYSDARIKKDVTTIEGALDLVGQMRGVRYTRIDTEKPGTGVIAQEMLEVMPEVVQQGVGDDDTLSVAYGNLVGVLIEAIKELEARVAELEGK
jgi:hypothetical protein